MNFQKINGEYYHSVFRNDYIGRFDEAVLIENGEIHYLKAMQKSGADFVNSLWLLNILLLQDITRGEIDAYFKVNVERQEFVQLRQKRLEIYGRAETGRGMNKKAKFISRQKY